MIKKAPNSYKALNSYIEGKHNQDECSGFIDGYYQCAQDNIDKKYSIHDMLKAFNAGTVYEFDSKKHPSFEDFIKLLS